MGDIFPRAAPSLSIVSVEINGQTGASFTTDGGFTVITVTIQNNSDPGPIRAVLYDSNGNIIENSTQSWLLTGQSFGFPVNTQISQSGTYTVHAQEQITGVWASIATFPIVITIGSGNRYSCIGGLCQADQGGPFNDPTCGGTCGPRYACVDGTCLQQPNGPYSDPACGGSCTRHLECRNGTCVYVPGEGTNQCPYDGASCTTTPTTPAPKPPQGSQIQGSPQTTPTNSSNFDLVLWLGVGAVGIAALVGLAMLAKAPSA